MQTLREGVSDVALANAVSTRTNIGIEMMKNAKIAGTDKVKCP
jgi:hypothetical protein